MSERRFVHLHTHSEYSEFDGLSSVPRIVEAAATDGQGAVAITDHGSIASLWALKREAAAAGIKPIPGIEAYMVTKGTRFEPERIHVAADSEEGDAGDGADSGSTGRATKSKIYEHLTILARTAEGLRNLVLLSNKSQQSKYSKYPLMDYELLAEHGEGLIVLTGCIGGPIAGPLSRITGEDSANDAAEMSRAAMNVQKMIAAVGRENVYVEVADHGIPAQQAALDRLYAFADEHGLKTVAANDSHYIAQREQPMHEGWISLGLSKQKGGKPVTINTPGRYQFSGHGHHFRTAAEMHAVRPDDVRWQDACDETARIADRVDEDLYPPTRLRVPRFPIPASFRAARRPRDVKPGEDAETLAYFLQKVKTGARKRFGSPTPQILERLARESAVIRDLRMMDYFLIVADLIEWARSDWTTQDWIDRHDGVRVVAEDDPERERKSPIRVGPGRGSAAGSLISFALWIVNADPLANGLLFERFLDPDRAEMPDIDVDFEKERRAEVIAYISARYGHDNVCYLGMHGTNKTRRALDSAGRYLEVSTAIVTEVKKLLHEDTPSIAALLTQRTDPGTVPDDLEGQERKAWGKKAEAYAKGIELRRYYGDHPDLKQFFRYASTYESVVTNPGKHACGFVISDEPLLPLVPMRLNKDGEWITEWDGADVAEFGLLKMDILGLRTLDIARAAEDNARANHGDIPFDFMEPALEGPLADKSWQMLGDGKSTGVFQLESSGMRDLLSTARPSNLDDLSALIAAFRPGPMSAGMHIDWAERTGGHKTVSYDSLTSDPAEQAVISSVLGETSGVILFQEQMMRLGKVVGNFTPADANQLRQAISKKKQDKLDQLKPRFIEGAQQPGIGEDGHPVPAISKATAERLWVAFEGSGEYAFNKCVRSQTKVRTANRTWNVGELYAKLHGTEAAGSATCACGKPKRSARRVCTTCESWVSKFRRNTSHDPKNPGGFRVLAYDFTDGRIRPKRVKDVHFNGVREILEITTDSGRTIGVTRNHRLMSAAHVWVHAGDLTVGDLLTMHGGFEPQRFDDYRTTKGDPDIRRSHVSPRMGYISGSMIDGGHSRLQRWTDATVATATCTRPGEHRGRLERAHLDGNRTNNSPSNLEWMCVSHHKAYDYRVNGRNRQWDVGHAATVEEVVSITALPAEQVYDLEMDDPGHNFIADGFVSHNSHTTAYGLVAYQTAYLKANWPAEFGAATLRFTETSKDKAPRRIAAMNSLRDDSIEVKAPDINMSDAQTTARDGRVWIGLGEVKGVGEISRAIVAERERHGAFASMADMVARVRQPGKNVGVTSAQLGALAQAGAFDRWGTRMGHLIASRAVSKSPAVPILPFEWSVVERASRQRDMLRATIDHHPTVVLAGKIRAQFAPTPERPARGKDLMELDALPGVGGRRVETYGIVSSIVPKYTRKGARMMTMDLESATSIVKTVGFSSVVEPLEKSGTLPAEGDLVSITGKVEIREYEREVEDEETGESSTETVTERSIVLDSVITLAVDDPTTDDSGRTAEPDNRPLGAPGPLKIGARLTGGPGSGDLRTPPPRSPEPGRSPVILESGVDTRVLPPDEDEPPDEDDSAPPPPPDPAARHAVDPDRHVVGTPTIEGIADPQESSTIPDDLVLQAESSPAWAEVVERLTADATAAGVHLSKLMIGRPVVSRDRVSSVVDPRTGSIHRLSSRSRDLTVPVSMPVIANFGGFTGTRWCVLVDPQRAMEEVELVRDALASGKWRPGTLGSIGRVLKT